jgi:hypothetical protein
MANKKQTGKGSKKIGRNKVVCSRYRSLGKREENKRRKQLKHQKAVDKRKNR